MAGVPALSFIVLGPEGRDGQHRLSQLASNLRTLKRRTEVLVTSPDPQLLRRALRSASADFVCIWDPDQCSLEAPQIEKFIQNLPTVWEVAVQSPRNRQPFVPLLVLRKHTAIEVFARLQATASPLLAALLVARAWGYREVALSLDPGAPSGNHVRRLTRWGARALYTRAGDWAQQKDVQAARKATRRRRATLRVLILAGTDDGLIDPQGSKDLNKGAASMSELRLLEGRYHEPFNDRDNEEVFTLIASWLANG